MSAADLVPPAAISLASGLAARAIDSAAKLALRRPMIARVLAPRAPTINFVATNVAGPRGPVYLAGHRMLDYVGMIPIGRQSWVRCGDSHLRSESIFGNDGRA